MKEQRFLLVTLTLLTLVGAPAVYSVVREPTPPGPRGAEMPPAAQRSIASTEVSVHRNAIKAKSVTLELICGEMATQETEGSLLRLTSDCWKSQSSQISVINKSNGFTAAVIETKTKGFTTDFIDLREGDNTLEISGTDQEGKAIEKVVLIKRRVPASIQ